MKSIFKFIGKIFLSLILVVLILWIIVLGSLQTKTGQDWAFNTVTKYFEQKTQTRIQVKKFSFSFPLNLGLEDVVFLQDDRPILTINKFEICCAYTSLLQGRMIFSRLHVDNIHILEIPNTSEFSKQETAHSWGMPLFPFYIKIENIDIQKLKLSPHVIKALKLPPEIEKITQQSTFNLNGMISNNPFKFALATHLLITARTEHTDLTPFSLGVDMQNHQLSLSFHSNDLPLQMLQTELPSYLKGHFALYASAPISTWQGVIQNPTYHKEPLKGHFKLTLNPIKDNNINPITAFVGSQTVLRGHFSLNSKDAIELIDLKFENPSIALTGSATIKSDKTIEKARFQGTINDLIRYQPWLGKNIQGQLSFEGHVSGDLSSPLFVMHVESPQLLVEEQSFQKIYSSVQTNPQNKDLNGFFNLSFDYQGIPWKATSSFNWMDQKQLTLSQLQIESLRLRLQGELSCSFPDHIWAGVLEANIDNLNDLSPFLAVPLNGEGQLKLNLTSVTNTHQQKQQAIQAQIIGHALKWTDWQAQQFVLNVNVNPLSDKHDVFDIQGSLDSKQLKWNDYFIDQFIADFSHQIELTSRNIIHFATRWEIQDIKWPDGKVAKASGQIQIENPLQPQEGHIEFAVNEVKTSSLQLQELTGATTIHANQALWPFEIKGQGVLKEDLLFNIDGNWHYQQNNIEIQAQHLTGRFGPYPLELKQPLYLHRNENEIELGSLWLQWGEAEIQGDFHQDKQNILSHLKTNAIPSELFHFIAPDLPLSGRATFQGHIAGPIHQPQGQFEIDLHQIQVIEEVFAKKPFMQGKLFLNLDEKGVQLKSELIGIGNRPLLIDGQLPFTLNLEPFKIKLNSDLPFNINLNAEGELDPFLHLFYNDVTNLSGHAKIALNFSGQINAPQIKGHIDLTNGAFESLSTGALYHNIEAHLEGDGAKIILTKLSAQDSKNGQISAKGTVSLDAGKQFPFEFEIHPSHIFILDSDYADISASGRLFLVGNTKKSKLQGELNIDKASIHLEEALPAKIKNIDIKYINVDENDPVLHYFENRETSSPIELEVKVNASQNVRIEGNHLKSDWKGFFLVTGTPDNIQLHGDLRISQGEYNFNGKVFNFSQGNIHFAGPPDKKTSLYVVASKEIDRITAEIIVKGPVTKPVISFRSSPPLSQREVLSYILFNRGISDITADQGDQLSQSFVSFNSSDQTKGNTDDFLSRLRNNIGIDRLDFTTNDNKENKDFGLQVGKHITEDIMVSVNKSMSSLAPIIAVEAKLRKNFKIQAEAGVEEDAPIRMSIKWKKDY